MVHFLQDNRGIKAQLQFLVQLCDHLHNGNSPLLPQCQRPSYIDKEELATLRVY